MKGFTFYYFFRYLLLIILSIIYLTIFIPLSFLLKLTGRDFFRLKISKNTKSYWIKRKKNLISMKKQF